MATFDISKVHNVSQGDARFRNKVRKAWECFSYERENILAQQQAVSWIKPGEVQIFFKIQLSDLPARTGRPPVHRYYWPTGTNGLETMLEMPKTTVFFPFGFSEGEPMIARHYFWADEKAVTALQTPYTPEALLNAASDIVQEVIPIPKIEWKPPMWKPLPADFNLRRSQSRAQVLLARF